MGLLCADIRFVPGKYYMCGFEGGEEPLARVGNFCRKLNKTPFCFSFVFLEFGKLPPTPPSLFWDSEKNWVSNCFFRVCTLGADY